MAYGKKYLNDFISGNQYAGRMNYGIRTDFKFKDPNEILVVRIRKMLFQTIRDPDANKEGFFRLLYLFEHIDDPYIMRLMYDDEQDELVKKTGFNANEIIYSPCSPEQGIGIDLPFHYPDKLYVGYQGKPSSLKDIKVWYHYEPFFWKGDEVLKIVDADC